VEPTEIGEMPEVIELSSSPPVPPPARSRLPVLIDQPMPQQQLSILDELFVRKTIDVDDLSDGELNAMLMSSPVVTKPKARLSQHLPAAEARAVSTESTRSSALFDDSFLDTYDGLEFPLEQPTKKRRLSPPASKSAARNALASIDAIYDLSSESDIAYKPQNQRLSAGTGITVCDPGSDKDDPAFPSFSSSARESRHGGVVAVSNRKGSSHIHILSDDDALPDDPIVNSSQPAKIAKVPGFSERTNSILTNITQKTNRSRAPSRSKNGATIDVIMKQSKAKQMARPKIDDLDNIVDSSQQGPASHSPERRPTATKKSKAPAKPRKTTVEKEAEQEEKRLAKERQAAEKQQAADKAEVNKRKTDRKKSAEEMLLCMPSALRGKALGNQVEGYMKEINVKVSF